MIDLAIVERVIKLSHRLNAERNRKMAIFANDLIGISINQFGVYEKEELDILFDFLTPLKETLAAGTCLDIGANIGNHSLYFAPIFAAVHSFEPHPATFRLLEFNVGDSENVIPHNFGLGDTKGSFTLRENPTNLGRFLDHGPERRRVSRHRDPRRMRRRPESRSRVALLREDRCRGFRGERTERRDQLHQGAPAADRAGTARVRVRRRLHTRHRHPAGPGLQLLLAPGGDSREIPVLAPACEPA